MTAIEKLRKHNVRWAKFAELYAIDPNGKAAALGAGFAESSARVQATRMLKRPIVIDAIRELQAIASAKTGITAERTLEEIGHPAFLDPAELFNEAGDLLDIHKMPESARRAISSFEVMSDDDGGTKTMKVKLVGKTEALNMLGRHFKMFTDKMVVEHNVVVKKRFVGHKTKT